MYVIAPCACIFDVSSLLFDWVSAFSCAFINNSIIGSWCLLKHLSEAGLVRLDYNDVKLVAEEDTAWRLWFFKLRQVFIVVTYVTKGLICVPKFFHVDLLLLLIPHPFMLLIRGMLASFVCLNSFMLTFCFY
jgi:hypothetical protein